VRLVAGCLAASLAFALPPAATAQNIARDRSYTLDPAPTYTDLVDPGDLTDLTDGRYTIGRFWLMKTTVGWSGHVRPVAITIDLGSVQPLRGASFSTAAGIAQVEWPAAILVLASDDGRSWRTLGDLVALSSLTPGNAPPTAGYATHRFQTDALRAHGRFVRFLVDGRGPYVFADEIEIERGDDAWVREETTEPPIGDTTEYFWRTRTNAQRRRAIERDLASARERLAGARIDAGLRRQLAVEIDAAADDLLSEPPVDPATFRAILPMGDVHARVFSIIGMLDAAAGLEPLTAWAANPWDFLTPLSRAAGPAEPLRIALMNGEIRSGALNLRNSTGSAFDVRVAIQGLPAGLEPDALSVFEVPWTETDSLIPVAAALVPAASEADDRYRVHIPAGMTRQAWLRFSPQAMEAGTWRGSVVVTQGEVPPIRIPLELRVFAGRFPDTPSLSLGGWDYTDGASYSTTADNVDAFVAVLREAGVDSPWASARAMPYPAFLPDGQVTALPATERFDRWIARWPGARRFLVFANVSDEIGGIPRGTPAFARAVGTWVTFWARHAARRALRAEQIELLLVDEPRRPDQERRVVDWAAAIRQAETGVRIWEDPVHDDPNAMSAEFIAAADVLSVNQTLAVRYGEPYRAFFRRQREAGRGLEIYGAEGPSRLLDPYGYYRLQAWLAASLGASGINFWSFADGGPSAWNEFANPRRVFSPLYVDPQSVVSGKAVEAIREGREDVEYLALLRSRVEEIGRTSPGHPSLAAARRLLETAVPEVLGAPDALDSYWRVPKDRSRADAVRIAMGEAIESLMDHR
jgi:hypothetical protein